MAKNQKDLFGGNTWTQEQENALLEARRKAHEKAVQEMNEGKRKRCPMTNEPCCGIGCCEDF